ncbi:MAG TPA: response regulator, partial [Thermoanaerobaculia bacterium]
VHPEDIERVETIRNEAWETGQASWSTEYRMRRADGTYAHVFHRALILRDAEKKPIRIVGALLDMTERKQLVDQLEQAKRVSSLGRVAASIAHEFNNILMGIQPNVEVIQRSSPTGLRTVTENIVRAVQRGKRVTDEILRFTRPAEPNLQSLDVAEFLAKWREETESLLGLVELEIDVPEEPIHVSADPMQLVQIFTNLALNARDAMQDRPGRLAISAHVSKSFGSFPFGVVKSPDRFVHLTVADEGCGISADRLNHIFEPLFTTKRGGIGLGLAVTYQIVTRHQGHIFVESEVGKGSTFHVFIPAALPDTVQAMSGEASNAAAIKRLVLVEDEPAVASGIAMLLEMEGIDVTTVYTGADAIPAIDTKEPDAVILDIGLPDMDGVGVYLEIQRRWPNLPVLFSSGHGDSAKLETYLSKPNVGFILKPYDFDAMRLQLTKLVGQNPAALAC